MEAALTTPVRDPMRLDDLLAPFHAAFTPEPLWRIGAEAEKFGVLEDTFAPLPYSGPRSVQAVFGLLQDRYGWFPESEVDGGEVIALVRGGASITLEPGAQLELSGTPLTSIHELSAELEVHARELRDVGTILGIAWLGMGFHPFAQQHELPWVPKLRYGVMREYLPTRGTMGLDMMRRTATVQVNLDYSSEADAMQKLRLALKLSPVITAMFANSPMVQGKLTGERSRRARVWLHMDPDRTGLLPFLWNERASFERYVEWALDVPMFLIKRGGGIVRNTGQTFREFMLHGYAGIHATPADWAAHLGSLFPEARLKKTLEIRGADSTPARLMPALPAFCKGLFYDDQARSAAEALLSDVRYEHAQLTRMAISEQGLRATLLERPLLDWAADLLDIAAGGLERLSRHADSRDGDERRFLAPLVTLVEQGQSPADALLARLDSDRDLRPQIVALTRL